MDALAATPPAHDVAFVAPDGTRLDVTAEDEEVRVILSPNPSHLEFVDPVVTGVRIFPSRFAVAAGRVASRSLLS
mgnify:CR=1 FL=1